MTNPDSLGKKIRQYREEKGITINKISEETGLTPSFISQFERDLTSASIASIQKITKVLNITMSDLFDNDPAANSPTVSTVSPVLVRKSDRKRIQYSNDSVDYLLTARNGRMEVIYSEIEAKSGSGEPYAHNSDEECIVILHGTMELTIDNDTYILHAGDAITFSSRLPHSWKNIDDTTVRAIWIITPPSF